MEFADSNARKYFIQDFLWDFRDLEDFSDKNNIYHKKHKTIQPQNKASA